MTRMTARIVATLVAMVMLGASGARGQMVTGAGMDDFARTFSLRDGGFEVVELRCDPPANVLWPGESPSLVFRVKNTGKTPLKGPARCDVARYGTRGRPGDMWRPVVFKIADGKPVEVALDLEPGGTATVSVKPEIPETFGGYALVLDLGEAGRKFAATLVCVPQPEPGRVW
jgi:hypothetical protein